MINLYKCYLIYSSVRAVVVAGSTPPRISVPFQAPMAYSSETGAVTLNPLVLAKSILNMGQLTEKTYDKIRNNQCLTVVAYGGSITVGGSPSPDQATSCVAMPCAAPPCAVQRACVPDSWESDRPEGVKDAWPNHLSKLLNGLLPCDGAGHVVENLGLSGMAMDHWVEQLAQSPPDADIVIVESSVNDVGMDNAKLLKSSETFTISLLKRNISVIFTGSSSRRLWDNTSHRSEDGDTVATHLMVAKLHNVPLISPIDAMGPFLTEDAAHFFVHTYRVDYCCHLSITAHRLIAHFIFYFLQLQYWGLNMPAFNGFTMQANRNTAQPVYNADTVTQLTKPLFVNESGFTASLTTSGWVFGEDVQGKPGLMTHNTSERVGYVLSAAAVREHALAHDVHFTFLHSYQHMGAALLEIMQCRCVEVQNFTDYRVLGSATVDFLWDKHISEAIVTEVPFTQVTDPDACIIVSITSVPSSPPRAENKIKFMGVTIY